jgi:hypothetical protein
MVVFVLCVRLSLDLYEVYVAYLQEKSREKESREMKEGKIIKKSLDCLIMKLFF